MSCCITWRAVCKCSCSHLQSRLWLYQQRWILLRPRTDCSRSGPNTAGRNHPHQTPAAQIIRTPTIVWSTISQTHNCTHSPSSTSNTPPAARAVWTCRMRCSGSPDSRWALILLQTQGPDPAGNTHSFYSPAGWTTWLILSIYTAILSRTFEMFTCILLTSAVMIHTLRIPVTDTATTVSSETHTHTLELVRHLQIESHYGL